MLSEAKSRKAGKNEKRKKMSLEQKVNDGIKTAMLGKDELTLRSLRAIKAGIIVAKTDKGAGGELNADAEIKLLQKLVKQRKESAEIYLQQKREDLAKPELEEISVIEKFLPKQMGEEEIRTELKKIIETTGAKSGADMGKVMGAASKHFAGKADNRIVSLLVKELLGV